MVYRDWEACKARLSSSHGPESGDEAGKVSFATHSEDGVRWCTEIGRLARRVSHHLTGLRVETKLARSDLTHPSEDNVQRLGDLQGESHLTGLRVETKLARSALTHPSKDGVQRLVDLQGESFVISQV